MPGKRKTRKQKKQKGSGRQTKNQQVVQPAEAVSLPPVTRTAQAEPVVAKKTRRQPKRKPGTKPGVLTSTGPGYPPTVQNALAVIDEEIEIQESQRRQIDTNLVTLKDNRTRLLDQVHSLASNFRIVELVPAMQAATLALATATEEMIASATGSETAPQARQQRTEIPAGFGPPELPRPRKPTPARKPKKKLPSRKGDINPLAAKVFTNTFGQGKAPATLVEALDIAYNGPEWREKTVLAGGGGGRKGVRITIEQDAANGWNKVSKMLAAGVKKLQKTRVDPEKAPAIVKSTYTQIVDHFKIEEVAKTVQSWGIPIEEE